MVASLSTVQPVPEKLKVVLPLAARVISPAVPLAPSMFRVPCSKVIFFTLAEWMVTVPLSTAIGPVAPPWAFTVMLAAAVLVVPSV